MRARAVFTIKNRESLCLVALAASRSGSSERQRRRRYYQRFYKQHDDWKKIEVAGHVVVVCITFSPMFSNKTIAFLTCFLPFQNCCCKSMLCSVEFWWNDDVTGRREVLFCVLPVWRQNQDFDTLFFQNCILVKCKYNCSSFRAKTGFWPTLFWVQTLLI